jgi:rhodanese-related sulfurtransferase
MMTLRADQSVSSLVQIDVLTLDALIKRGGATPVLLDVREVDELAICQIPNNTHIPLGHLSQRAAELPSDRLIIVYCHHGGRSARATQWLVQNGFSEVANLVGGIDAWATQIAPDMQRY